MAPSSAALPHDLYVVSDLHLGRGFSPETKRWARLETFLYDEDFRAFCHWIGREAQGSPGPVGLVLAGDVFDFLRIEPGEAPPGARGTERRFGPLPTPEVAARMAADILAGHPAFVEGLAGLLAAGHEVLLLPGNHDLELQSDEVRAVVRRSVGARLDAMQAPPASLGGLRFEAWFLHEPGRLWIEHGCQYDVENAFRFPLRRRLAPAQAKAVAEGDQPLGNFFQKYLYNAFGNITFIVPSSRANYRYFRWLLLNEPRLLARVAWSQGRFLVQLLRRLARLQAGDWEREAEAAHQEELAALARETGLGERLLEVDRLKATGADVVSAASGMLRQGLKLVLGATAGTLLALATFVAASTAISALVSGVGWRALLSLGLYLVFAALTAAGLMAASLRVPRDHHRGGLGEAAARLASALDVPLVVLGHTHDEVVTPLVRDGGGRAWYFNTGTWVAVFTHDVLVPRERSQFTFLRIQGTEGELLHWSPGRDRPLPVILLEEEGHFWESEGR